MKLMLTITTADTLIHDFPWPEGVPYPAVGDDVITHFEGKLLAFRVKQRLISVGTDIHGDPATQFSLKVEETSQE